MKSIEQDLTTIHTPAKALVIYRSNQEITNCYVEAFDFNAEGKMVDPHPLSMMESQELAQSLLTTDRLSDHYLQPKGLIPANLLYLDHAGDGAIVWFTPPLRRRLVFTTELSLSDGTYALPGLIWKADRNSLKIYAVKETGKPTLSTKLFHAPFFNVYDAGNVCMGTVDIDIDRYTHLESFIAKWEDYFFNSKFSHVLGERSPTSSNIIQTWKALFNNTKKFPVNALRKHYQTLKELIHETN